MDLLQQIIQCQDLPRDLLGSISCSALICIHHHSRRPLWSLVLCHLCTQDGLPLRLCSLASFFLVQDGSFTHTSHGSGGLRSTFSITMLLIWLLVVYVCVISSPISLIENTNTFVVAAAVFYVAKTNFLPRYQADKEFRWDYDFVEIGNSYSYDPSYSLHDFDGDYHSEDDEWTSASSSSVSSGCRTPVDDAAGFWESANEASAANETTDRV